MMCDQYHEMISRFIDHELEGEETAALFAHGGACVECQEFFHDALRLRVTIVQERETEYVPVPAFTPRKKKAYLFETMKSLHDRIRLRDRQVSLSLPMAAAITSFLIATSVLATMLSVGRNEQQTILPQSKEVVMILPAVEVQGYYLPNGVNHSTGKQF